MSDHADHLWQGALMVDLVIAFTLLEAVALLLYRRATGRGVGAAALLPNLAAGLCLLLGLSAALHAQTWPWIALALTGAGLAHAMDLRERWRASRIAAPR